MGSKPKKTVAVVLHTHDEGACTYICKNDEIAWSVAGRLVYENLHEFDNATLVVVGDVVMDEQTCRQAGIECARALMGGYYEQAVKLYNDNCAGSCESIEVDPCVELDERIETIPQSDLLAYVARFEALLEEAADNGEEEKVRGGQDEVANPVGGDAEAPAEPEVSD